MNARYLIIFFFNFLALSITSLLLWKFQIKKMNVSEKFRNIVKKLLIAYVFILPSSIVLLFAEVIPTWFALFIFLFVSFGFMLIFMVSGVLVNLLFWVAKPWIDNTFQPARRDFLQQNLALGVGTVASGYGAYSALKVPDSPRVEIPILPDHSTDLHGFCIMQISDLHVGATIRKEFVEKVVEICNQKKPDLVVLTGDMVDGTVEHLEAHVAPLQKLTAKHGVIYILGNHDYYSGSEPWLKHFQSLNFKTLKNESHAILHGSEKLEIIGLDEWSSPRFGGEGFQIDKAMAGCDANAIKIVLNHQPRGFEEAVDKGAHLQLSGHTHGGQIWPFTFLVYFVHKYVKGLYRHKNSYIYVSSGTGFWGPAVRLGAPSEVTEIVLTRKST